MPKSTEAEKRAAKKYAETVDHAGVILPKGTKDKIRSIGEDGISQYINRLVEKDLKIRHRNVVEGARKRIRKDIESCKTVEDWHKAFTALRQDFEDEVRGEADFEQYIKDTLGEQALAFFLKNVTIPAFTEDTLRHLSAMDDFFEGRDAWLSPVDGCEDEFVLNFIEKQNKPENMAEEDYMYLSHLYSAAVVRDEQLEAGIVNFLGEEAFERLVSQGDYEKDKLYQAAMASTTNKAKQNKYLLDWLTSRGIFAPDAPTEEEGLESEGWELPTNPPEKVQPVVMLLADGAARMGCYTPPQYTRKNKRPMWGSGRFDYSSLIIGWKPLVPVKKTKEEAHNELTEEAWSEVLANMKDLPEDEEEARKVAADNIARNVVHAALNVLGLSFPPRQENLDKLSKLAVNADQIVLVMGDTGFCRVDRILRMAQEEFVSIDGMTFEEISKAALEVCIDSELVEYDEQSEESLVRLTSKGIVHWDDFSREKPPFHPSILTDETIAKELAAVAAEKVLEKYGANFPYDHERDLPSSDEESLADIYAEKNGKQFCVECVDLINVEPSRRNEILIDTFERLKTLAQFEYDVYFVFFNRESMKAWEHLGITLKGVAAKKIYIMSFDEFCNKFSS